MVGMKDKGIPIEEDIVGVSREPVSTTTVTGEHGVICLAERMSKPRRDVAQQDGRS